jgi:hypothetical protein
MHKTITYLYTTCLSGQTGITAGAVSCLVTDTLTIYDPTFRRLNVLISYVLHMFHTRALSYIKPTNSHWQDLFDDRLLIANMFRPYTRPSPGCLKEC